MKNKAFRSPPLGLQVHRQLVDGHARLPHDGLSQGALLTRRQRLAIDHPDLDRARATFSTTGKLLGQSHPVFGMEITENFHYHRLVSQVIRTDHCLPPPRLMKTKALPLY